MDAFDALLAGNAAPDAPPTRMDRWAGRIGGALSWLFGLAVLISVYEVVMRYAFSAPSSWAHATTTTLCQIGFAFGGAWCMAKRSHIRISFVTDALNPRKRWWTELLAQTVGLFYLGGLLYAVGLDAKASLWKFDYAGAWAPELTPGPPNWPLPSIGKAALFLGTLLFLLVLLMHCIEHLRRRRG